MPTPLPLTQHITLSCLLSLRLGYCKWHHIGHVSWVYLKARRCGLATILVPSLGLFEGVLLHWCKRDLLLVIVSTMMSLGPLMRVYIMG